MDKIELKPSEATAYWWVKKIKTKVKDISINGGNPEEIKFKSFFINYKETDWRLLYEGLSYYIRENILVNNLFSQATSKGKHNMINHALSIILHNMIPDIDISTGNISNIISTNSMIAGEKQINDAIEYVLEPVNPYYILTGDFDDLNFYYILIATLALIDADNNKTDKDYNALTKYVTEGYKDIFFPEKDNVDDEIKKRWDLAISQAEHENIINVRHDVEPPTYTTKFHKIDYNGIDLYIDYAMDIASKILGEDIDTLKNQYTKKRKND